MFLTVCVYAPYGKNHVLYKNKLQLLFFVFNKYETSYCNFYQLFIKY